MDSLVHQDVHSRWCANRYAPTALGFVAFCALGAIQSWRGLGKEILKGDTVLLLGILFVIAMLLQLFVSLKCVRERIVLGLLIMRFALGFIVKMAPPLSGTAADVWKGGSFALWAAALGVSLSMLYSSLRFRPPEPVN